MCLELKHVTSFILKKLQVICFVLLCQLIIITSCQEQREADFVWNELVTRRQIVRWLGDESSSSEVANACVAKSIYEACQHDQYFKDCSFTEENIQTYGYLIMCRDHLTMCNSVDAVSGLNLFCWMGVFNVAAFFLKNRNNQLLVAVVVVVVGCWLLVVGCCCCCCCCLFVR